MQKIQNFIYWACVGSEISHIFCCGLPMLFSAMSLISSLGLVAAMPASLEFLHESIHDYEIPMIMASGLIILMGWALHYVAYRIDCRSAGCCHEPCAPKKKNSYKVLAVATALFALNVTGYFLIHA